MTLCAYCWSPVEPPAKRPRMEIVFRSRADILTSDDLWDPPAALAIVSGELDDGWPASESRRVRIKVTEPDRPVYCSDAHRWADQRNPDAPVNPKLLDAITAGLASGAGDIEAQGEQEAMF